MAWVSQGHKGNVWKHVERRELKEVEPQEWKNERRAGICVGMKDDGS